MGRQKQCSSLVCVAAKQNALTEHIKFRHKQQHVRHKTTTTGEDSSDKRVWVLVWVFVLVVGSW
jgi:hypothetical protein